MIIRYEHQHYHHFPPDARTEEFQRTVLGHLGQLLAAARADKKRDLKIMALEDDILAKLAAAKTANDGFRVILKAIRDNQGNPAKLQAIAASIDEDENAWVEAFKENVEPPPPPAT